jgi:phage-related protein
MLAGFLVKAMQALLPAVAQLAMSLLKILIALTPLLPPIMQLASILIKLALSALTPLIPLITTLAGWLSGLAGIIATVVGWIAKIVAAALTWITHFSDVKKTISDVWNWIKEHWPLLLDVLTGPIGLAVNFIRTHWTQIVNGAKEVWHDVVHWFDEMGTDIRGFFDKLATDLFTAGKKIIQFLANGIKAAVGDVEHAVGSVVDDIKSFLPFSPARKGPLSGSGSPDRSGSQIAAMLAAGMTSGRPAVEAAAAQLARSAGISPGGSLAGYSAAGAGAGGPMTIQLQLGSGGTGLDQLFMTWLKNAVRSGGGDPAIFNKKVKFA